MKEKRERGREREKEQNPRHDVGPWIRKTSDRNHNETASPPDRWLDALNLQIFLLRINLKARRIWNRNRHQEKILRLKPPKRISIHDQDPDIVTSLQTMQPKKTHSYNSSHNITSISIVQQSFDYSDHGKERSSNEIRRSNHDIASRSPHNP